MKTGSAKSLKFKPEKPLKPHVKLFKASALIRRKFFIDIVNRRLWQKKYYYYRSKSFIYDFNSKYNR